MQETTSSPRSSTTSRSTPWVEGCCGPMLMTIRSSSPSAWARALTSAQSPPPLARTCWARGGDGRGGRGLDGDADLEPQPDLVVARGEVVVDAEPVRPVRVVGAGQGG